MNKKAQGMSLQLIVIAVLVLVVAVVLISIFTGKANLFRKGISGCAEIGGKCQYTSDSPCEGAQIEATGCLEDQICCVAPIKPNP